MTSDTRKALEAVFPYANVINVIGSDYDRDIVKSAIGLEDKGNILSGTYAPMNISMHVLDGFMVVIGCAAVAAAFILLNAATLGTAGLVVAGVGGASILAGVGLFATETYKNRQTTPNDSLDDSANTAFS